MQRMGITGRIQQQIMKSCCTGSLGLIAEAEENFCVGLYRTHCPDRRQFYLAVQIAHRGLIRFANRYADLAEQMAAEEDDGTRKAELGA